MEGEVGRFRRNHLVPVPQVSTIAELNALLDAWDQEDEGRRIADRTRTVGEFFAIERPLLAPLPPEAFETGRVFTPRVDRYAQVSVRMNRYSVRSADRPSGRVLLHASELVVYDGRGGRPAWRLRRQPPGAGPLPGGLLRKPGACPGDGPGAGPRRREVHPGQTLVGGGASHGTGARLSRRCTHGLRARGRRDRRRAAGRGDDRRRGRDGGTQGRRRQPARRRGTARRDPPAVPGDLTHRAAPGRPAGGLPAAAVGSRL